MDLLALGAAWLAGTNRSYAAQSVSFVQGGATYVVAAKLGRSEVQTEDTEGAISVFESTDFIVNTLDVTVAGVFVEPAPGSQIIFDGNTFEVMAAPGAGCWRWVDAYRQELRIHAKLVARS